MGPYVVASGSGVAILECLTDTETVHPRKTVSQISVRTPEGLADGLLPCVRTETPRAHGPEGVWHRSMLGNNELRLSSTMAG